MRTNTKPVPAPLRPGTAPFVLEGEIKLSSMGLWSTLLGFCVLVVLRLLLPTAGRPFPSLGALILWALCTAGFYFGVRVIAFELVRSKARREFRQRNPPSRVFPQAGIPRNLFLAASLAGVASLIPLCFGLLGVGIGFGPQFWVVISVGTALSLRDLMGAAHILFVDPSRWIRETSTGLDILEPSWEVRS